MITVKPYHAELAMVWDDLLLKTRARNFLFLRKYMDYHCDRFVDRSLIVESADRPIAVFPASSHVKTIISHAGLTYGGLIATERLRTEDTLRVFDKIRKHYFELGIEKLIYKAIPYIFQQYPVQEDLYALFRFGAKVIRRDVSSVIALDKDFRYSKGCKWSINKARKAKISLNVGNDFPTFHVMLSSLLKKFEVAPTHSLSEIILLHERFPNEIVLYEARLENELLAGSVVYDLGDTVHTQYLAASDRGREVGALDFLLADLIENVYKDRRYFSFGISTENDGKTLNSGLIAYKEGFGARAVVHDFYEWIL
jgi:hypothetical protein